MSLVNSNTYIEPVSGTALNTARFNVNNSLRSVLSNFKSPAPPVAVNLTASGSNIGEVDGMLYRSATTNALYISDSVHAKSSPVGGNFTRVGIGNRVENGIVALAANAESYEIGELVATVSEDGVLGANARLYVCTSNSLTNGSTSGFLDVGVSRITADTTDTTTYPIFASTTSGDLVSANVSSSKLNFNPSTGRLSATIFNSLSDYRYKTNIETIQNSLDKVNALRGVSYSMEDSNEVGLIAQEVENVVPEAVSGDNPKTVAYGNLVGLLVEAIKELSNKVDRLESIINENSY